MKTGVNSVTVRVEDPPTDRYIPRGKQYWEPKSKSIFYTRTTGIWQPVWLEAAGQSYLERVHLTPSLDGIVRVAARVVNPAKGLTLRAIGVTGPQFWSVDNPRLYDIAYELRRGGEVLDRVKSYFGFRAVETRNGRVYLNGRPV